MNVRTVTPDLTNMPIVERRRPGRIGFSNPSLIALLRHSTRNTPIVPDTESIDTDADSHEHSADSLSPVDGACQLGAISPNGNVTLPIINQPAEPEFRSDIGSYFSGTKLATTSGIKVVDEISVGDVVLTGSANRTVVDVQRIASEVPPIYMRRHALADGVPGHDIWVAPTQCLLVEGRLVPVILLVNGLTILSDTSSATGRYYQLRFAEPEHDKPVTNGVDIASIDYELQQRAALLGYDRPMPVGSQDADLLINVNGKSLSPVEICENRRTFVVPANESLGLAARCDLNVMTIEIVQQDSYQVISADHPDLLEGWGSAHHDGHAFSRPITGLARLPTAPIERAAKVVVWLR